MSLGSSHHSVYAVRTTSGRELDVAFIVEKRILEKIEKGEDSSVKAIFTTPDVKGFVFIETDKPEEVYKLISNIKYVKASRPLKIPVEEIIGVLKPKVEIEELSVGDEVEIIRGPFRGMKARVISVDKSKNVVTVNLLEAAFTIPVTIQATYVKKIKR